MTGTWATGWATSDVDSATEFAKGWGSVFDTTLGASAANVDITGILQTYAHLKIVASCRGDAASANASLDLRFNGDTAANYDYQVARGIGGSTVSAETFAATFATVGVIPAGTALAGCYSANLIDVPFYASIVGNKACTGISSEKHGTSASNMLTELYSGFWRSTAAVNRITLFPAGGNFVAGTRVTLYAMGA